MESDKPEELQLPIRPARSAKLTNISTLKVVSNHLPISIIPQQKQTPLICIYSIACEPEIPNDSRRKFRSLVSLIEPGLKEDIGKYVLSGRNIFAFKKKEGVLTHVAIDKATKEEFIFTVKLTRMTEMQNLQNENIANYKVATQSINIIIKQMMRNMKMVEIGKTLKFFYNDDKNINKLDLENCRLQVRNGFKTSLEMCKDGSRLLVDFCTRVLRSDTVLDIINYSNKSQKELKEYLIDHSVLADYANYRNYRITDIDFKKTPKSTFQSIKGDISYAEYFLSKYSIKIKDLNQPMLVSSIFERKPDGTKAERTVHLVPELCKMTGLDDDQRADYRVMKDLAKYTKLEPADRMDRISNHINNLNKQLKAENWSMSINDFVKFDAHQIRAPELKLLSEVIKPNESGSFMLRSKILEPVVLDYWILLYSGRGPKDDEEVENFYQNLRKAAGTFGIKVVEPLYVLVKGIKGSDYVQALKDNMDPKVQCVIAFIPKAAKNTVYKAFKKFCTQDKPVPSQVVVSSSVFKNAMSVCSKIILQINAKMGCSLWTTQTPEGLSKKTMVIGADVYHNVGAKKQSVIGFCASYDEKFSKFYSRIKFQQKIGEEIMSNIALLIQDALKFYFKKAKELPDTIIFYRDGVGEGQLNDVLKTEIPNILKGFQLVNKNYAPNFVEVVVTKKINDRFFVPNGKAGGLKYYNPPSGTLIMDNVVSKNYDFFLCAQEVTQGTCTPTHYTVVHNKSNITEDVLAKFTYYQCFNYFNWTGAIRVPSCVQYASKIAFLVGQTLSAEVGEQLNDKLFFL